MISSFIDGRVRLRDPALKNAQTLALVESLISSREGVKSFVANPRTGSILLEYDPAVISQEDLMQAAQMLEGHLRPASEANRCKSFLARLACPSSATLRRLESRLGSAALALTLFGLFGPKRLHLIGGGLFTLFAAKHMYSRRKGL